MSSAVSTPGTPSLTRYRFNDPGTPVEKVNIACCSLKIYHNGRRRTHVYSVHLAYFSSQVLRSRIAVCLSVKTSLLAKPFTHENVSIDMKGFEQDSL